VREFFTGIGKFRDSAAKRKTPGTWPGLSPSPEAISRAVMGPRKASFSLRFAFARELSSNTDLKHDDRPSTARTPVGRYLEPSLFDDAGQL